MTATSLDLSQIRTDALSSAATFRTLIGLGTGDTPTFKGATLSTGTITASTPAVDISQTWNNSGVTFTGSKINITDTASASESIIADYQLGGVSQFAITKGGTSGIGYPAGFRIKTPNYQMYWDTGAGGLLFRNSADSSYVNLYCNHVGSTGFLYGSGVITDALEVVNLSWRGAEQAVNLKGSVGITWNNGATFTSPDLTLVRDGAGILAQRRTTNAQTFRIYNTTDSGIANYERAKLAWESNTFVIGTEIAGTSVTPRNIAFTGGNVGIGTTSPLLKLHVAGTVGGLGRVATYINNLSSNGYSELVFDNDVAYDSSPAGSFVFGYGGTATANSNQAYFWNRRNAAILFGTNNLERMRIDGSGNLGLGQSSPDAKLDILDTTSAGSGSLAASTLNIASTWNTTGTPTAFKLNVTEVQSDAASLLMDLQVGGGSKAGITKAGKIFSDAAANLDWFSGRYAGTEYIRLGFQGSVGYGLFSGSVYSGNTGNGFGIGPTVNIFANTTWGSGTSSSTFITFSHANNTSPVIKLERVGYTTKPALLIDQTTGTTSYPFEVQLNSVRKHAVASSGNVEIYNAFTNDSNYERGKLEWSSNAFRIGTEKAGTGSARALEFQTDGTTRLTIGTTGNTTLANGYLYFEDANGYITRTSATNTMTFAPSNASGAMQLSSGLMALYGTLRFGVDSGATTNYTISGSNRGGNNLTAISLTISGGNGTFAGTGNAGGNVLISGGAAIAGNNNGGFVYLDGGLNNGSGSTGDVVIGNTRGNLQLADARNVIVGTTTGTKIGTATTQKLGFYNATPVVQPTAVADATDAASVITQLNALLSRMRDLGLIAT